MDSPENNGSAATQAPYATEEFNRLLGEIAERWRAHRGEDLKLRYQTGELLNRQYGDPTKRQKRGTGTLLREADQLGIAQSEISRLRRFSHRFKSFTDFKAAHPEATWTTVKSDILPSLMSEDKRKAKGSSGGDAKGTVKPKPRIPVADILAKALAGLSQQLSCSRKEISESERERLLVHVQELVKALNECLQIQLAVPGSPGETPAADQADLLSAAPKPSADQAA